jgi:hypothetical protein
MKITVLTDSIVRPVSADRFGMALGTDVCRAVPELILDPDHDHDGELDTI